MIYDDKMLASLKGFTPGPWEIFKSKYGGFVICERGYPVNSPDRPDGRRNIALIAAAPDLHRIATEQAAEIARLQALLENAIDHHYAAMCVVRGNLDDSYKPMAEGMKSACNRWRSELPNSSLRGHYE